MARHVVAAVAEIPPGGRKVVEAGGRQIVVFNLGGEFFALLDRCPHQGCRLSTGMLCGEVESRVPGEYKYGRVGEMLRCAWHQWQFDIRTGKSWFDPRRTKVRPFPAGVAPGSEIVEGSYVAETFPVQVEDSYVVVEA